MGKFLIREKYCIKQYKNSTCDKCEQVCPTMAIHEGVINAEKCVSCGLCYAVCPAAAIATSVELDKIVAQYDKQTALCLSCQKVKRSSEIPCLAILNDRVLWILAQKAQVSIDLSKCKSCNYKVFAALWASIINCNKNLCAQQQITIIEQDNQPVEASNIDRRQFLQQMLGASVLFIEEVQKGEAVQICKPCSLNLFMQNVVSPEQAADNDLFFSCIIKSQCNACGLCVKLCPQEALYIETKEAKVQIRFERRLCTNCGLCVGQCPQNAIDISYQYQAMTCFTVDMPYCQQCGIAFQPIGDEMNCLSCIQKERILK